MSPPTTDPLLVLRTITTDLTTTSEPVLPSHIPVIAGQLYASPILDAAISLSSSAGARGSEDAVVLVNKYKTRVTALLQSRVSQARWCGVVLAKCAVESSFEALAAWGGVWGKALIGLVTRPEPTTTAVMVIRTLTRMFTALSAEKPTLTREIVTPHLPAFFAGLLAACKSEDVRVVASALEALRDLITAHPVTFRPFSGKAKAAVLRHLEGEHERLAREVFVKLHLCASNSSKRASGQEGVKGNAAAGEWKDVFCAVLEEMHSTMDLVFKPVVEHYDYRHSVGKSAATLGLEPLGEDGGAQTERLLLLIRLLGTFFTTSTTVQPQIPLAQLVDATSRAFAITVTSATHNPAVEKIPREMLLALLTTIHAATLNLLDTIAHRLQHFLFPFIPALLEQTAYILSEEPWSADIRVAAYTLTNTLLTLSGPALSKATIGSLHPVFSTCCDDLLLLPASASAPKKQTHADSFMSSTSTGVVSPPALATAAEELLATTLAKVQPPLLKADVRAKLERTAVITGNKEALLAAVLFPRVAARCGVVPHLVRNGVGIAEEALVRPRMPVVWTGLSWGEVRIQIQEADDAREDKGEEEEVAQEVVERVQVEVEDILEHRSVKRLRTEEEPPAPAPSLTVSAAPPAAPPFFSQLLPPATLAPPAAKSPEKLYPSLTPSAVVYPTLNDNIVIQQTPITATATSPLKTFGDGSQQQLRKEAEISEEGGDSEMEEVEIVLGDSDESDDE